MKVKLTWYLQWTFLFINIILFQEASPYTPMSTETKVRFRTEFENMDTDKDGVLSINEVAYNIYRGVISQYPNGISREDFKGVAGQEAFNKQDINHDGHVSTDEIKVAVTKKVEDGYFPDRDKNQDGVISFDEYH